jgi:hypothetical protein
MLRDGAPMRVMQREDQTAPPADSTKGELGAR